LREVRERKWIDEKVKREERGGEGEEKGRDGS